MQIIFCKNLARELHKVLKGLIRVTYVDKTDSINIDIQCDETKWHYEMCNVSNFMQYNGSEVASRLLVIEYKRFIKRITNEKYFR